MEENTLKFIDSRLDGSKRKLNHVCWAAPNGRERSRVAVCLFDTVHILEFKLTKDSLEDKSSRQVSYKQHRCLDCRWNEDGTVLAVTYVQQYSKIIALYEENIQGE